MYLIEDIHLKCSRKIYYQADQKQSEKSVILMLINVKEPSVHILIEDYCNHDK